MFGTKKKHAKNDKKVFIFCEQYLIFCMFCTVHVLCSVHYWLILKDADIGARADVQ